MAQIVIIIIVICSLAIPAGAPHALSSWAQAPFPETTGILGKDPGRRFGDHAPEFAEDVIVGLAQVGCGLRRQVAAFLGERQPGLRFRVASRPWGVLREGEGEGPPLWLRHHSAC